MKVCERSLSGSGAGSNVAAASQFVRAEMLPSGYLIRPCEGGGSIIHIVDHLNLQVFFFLLNELHLFLINRDCKSINFLSGMECARGVEAAL